MTGLKTLRLQTPVFCHSLLSEVVDIRKTIKTYYFHPSLEEPLLSLENDFLKYKLRIWGFE